MKHHSAYNSHFIWQQVLGVATSATSSSPGTNARDNFGSYDDVTAAIETNRKLQRNLKDRHQKISHVERKYKREWRGTRKGAS